MRAKVTLTPQRAGVMPEMLDFASARQLLIDAAQPIARTRRLSLADALNTVLSEDVKALTDSPPFDVSTLDGYAIATADLSADDETQLQVTQRIAAGSLGRTLTRGECARIFTGAQLPPGANAIVAQENVALLDGAIRFASRPAPYEDVRRQGADFRAEQMLLPQGTRLNAAHLGLLASAGIATVEVFQPLRVALLTTGDELIEPGEALQPGCIYNANASLLRGLLQGLGCHITQLQHIADDPAQTRLALAQAADGCDVIITTGGVSVGEEDHMRAAIEALGTIQLWRVRMKPGKPLAFGQIGQTPIIGLPGNPVSTFATFVLFARAFLLKRMGAQVPTLRPLHLPARFSTQRLSDRLEFARARITADQGIELYPRQNSGILSSLSWADVLVEIPEQTLIAEGDLLRVHLLCELMA